MVQSHVVNNIYRYHPLFSYFSRDLSSYHLIYQDQLLYKKSPIPQNEIYDNESVRDGNHLVLQIHMPCRYTGRRNPAPADQRRSAAGSRSPVSMEIYRIGDRYGSFCPDLSSLLQISVPPWSFLRSLQPIQSVSTDP